MKIVLILLLASHVLRTVKIAQMLALVIYARMVTISVLKDLARNALIYARNVL
jgi:hypothetical protein